MAQIPKLTPPRGKQLIAQLLLSATPVELFDDRSLFSVRSGTSRIERLIIN